MHSSCTLHANTWWGCSTRNAGWFATAAAWECTNSVENSAVVKWVKEKYAAFIEAKYCSFWEHPEGEHSAAKTTVTIDGNALLGGAEGAFTIYAGKEGRGGWRGGHTERHIEATHTESQALKQCR